METLNMLIATMEYPPYPIGGIGAFALNLMSEFKNHNITVLTHQVKGSESKSEENDGNITVKRLKTPGLSFLHKSISQKQNRSVIDQRILFGISLRNFLKKEANLKDYDIMHNIDVNSAQFIDYKEINKKLPTVATVHDYYALSASLNPFKFPYKSTDFILRYPHYNMMKQMNLRVIKKSSRINVNSSFVRDIVSKEGGIPKEKLDVVYSAIDYKRFDLTPPKDKYTNHSVLFIGGNMERKGAKYVVHSAPKILKEFPDAKFTLVGDANKKYNSEINSFIKTNNIENSFEFIKHVSNKELEEHYQKTNIFIMPSIIEGLGLVYVEAMDAQTPVIGTRVGGVPEVIRDGSGLLVEPQNSDQIADSIISIFKDPEAAKEMGRKGKEVVKKYFTKEALAKRVLDSYQKAIESHSKVNLVG